MIVASGKRIVVRYDRVGSPGCNLSVHGIKFTEVEYIDPVLSHYYGRFGVDKGYNVITFPLLDD